MTVYALEHFQEFYDLVKCQAAIQAWTRTTGPHDEPNRWALRVTTLACANTSSSVLAATVPSQRVTCNTTALNNCQALCPTKANEHTTPQRCNTMTATQMDEGNTPEMTSTHIASASSTPATQVNTQRGNATRVTHVLRTRSPE